MHKQKAFRSVISPSSFRLRRGLTSKQDITEIDMLETNERMSSAVYDVPTLSTQNTAYFRICLAAATLALDVVDLPIMVGARRRWV